jgi:hypothetical protein
LGNLQGEVPTKFDKRRLITMATKKKATKKAAKKKKK